MGLIREPKNIDFTNQSKPWSEAELREFRELMQNIKAKNSQRKQRLLRTKKAVVVSVK